jgi:hypothetical protein
MSMPTPEFYVPRGDSSRRSRWVSTPMREVTTGLPATLYNEWRPDNAGYSRLCLQGENAEQRARDLADRTGGAYDRRQHGVGGYVEHRVTWKHETV